MGENSILVTGSSGFVGRSVVSTLIKEKNVKCAIHHRSVDSSDPSPAINYFSSELSADFDWTGLLQDISAVVHCAARVHVSVKRSDEALASFRTVNVAGTLQLARQAALAGVKRFIFISSIGVLGDQTHDKPFSEDDLPNPHSPYALSKLEAESGLREIEQRSGMQVVIIRPPMVYGADAPGSFGFLLRCIQMGLPLPLGSIVNNRRSFIFIENLVDFIRLCLDHPAAPGQTFVLADGDDLSTAALIKKLASALGVSARLISVSPAVLNWCADRACRAAMARSLTASLQVDISKACSLLDWKPPVSLDEGLCRSVKRRH